MGIRYNKEYTPKDRRLSMSGPRDMQRKTAFTSPVAPDVDSELVKQLQATIKGLQEQLKETPIADGTFTAEQVNDEIIKAVKAETADLKEKYEQQLKALEISNKELEAKLESKDQLIEKLEVSSSQAAVSEGDMAKMMESMKEEMKRLALAAGQPIEEVDPDRPQMEQAFVDPIEKEAKVESHITIEEDVSITKKEEMNDQVDKLRGLLGKLPSK